jgi:Domain of Unknown Function (DUF1206)
MRRWWATRQGRTGGARQISARVWAPPRPPRSRGGGTALLLAKPAGQWLVGLGGVLVIGGGLAQLYRAYRADFRDKIKLNEMSATEKQWVIALGRFGYAAQGVVVGIIGVLLIVAAAHARPKEARGLGGALVALAQRPIGPWLLALAAAGRLARFRRMVIA